jgi:hypothetical protein
MNRILLATLAILLLLPSPLYAGWPKESGILEPVEIFDQYYGTDQMHKVANVVTGNFRNGQSRSKWAAEVSRQLRDIQYERLSSEIKGQILTDDKATILIRATIGTVAGKVEHDEIYRLIRKKGTWLIDEAEVINEDIKPQGIEI